MGRKKHKKPASPVEGDLTEKKPPVIVTFLPVILVLIFAGVPFVLGKYMELNMPGPFDSGAYVQSAKKLIEGAKYNVEEMSSAKAGTLLVNIIGVKFFGYNDFGPKIVQGVMQLAALCMMFYTLRRIYGSCAAVIGVTMAAFYLSAPVIGKYGNVKEQYMIAMMIIAGCGFILAQICDKWWWPLTAGASMINIYYFKETGLSVVLAMFVYLVAVMIMKRVSLKKVLNDVTYILAGAVVGLLPMLVFHIKLGAMAKFKSSLPVYMIAAGLVVVIPAWIVYRLINKPGADATGAEQPDELKLSKKTVYIASAVFVAAIAAAAYMLGFVDKINKIISSSGGYLALSRGARSYSDQAKYVFGYYSVLNLPIMMACIGIVIGLVQFVKRVAAKVKPEVDLHDTVVLFLAVWWIFDMAFVWISPRPYEQYYLPLNAPAAMLAGYVIWRYCELAKNSQSKPPFVIGGAVCVFIMIAMAWPVYGGLSHSPYSGAKYERQGVAYKARGYVQRLEEVKAAKKSTAPWKKVGDYIRNNSSEEDTIYVWGWIPGIYVRSQRLSAARNASYSDMHVNSPVQLGRYCVWLIEDFEKNKPKFIVDTQKMHFPNDRPPLELWPRTSKGFLPNNQIAIESFDKSYMNFLTEKINAEEAERYKAMGDIRQYIRDNYRIVNLKSIGRIVVLERKKDAD